MTRQKHRVGLALQLVRQRIGRTSGLPRHLDPVGQPPQVFQQHKAQDGGNGPDLADRQITDRLKTVDTFGQTFQRQIGIADRDIGPDQGERSGHRAAGQPQRRQVAVHPGRQIAAQVAKGFINDVVIVQQPLRRRGHKAVRPGFRQKPPIGLPDRIAIVGHPRGQGKGHKTRQVRAGRLRQGGTRIAQRPALPEFQPDRGGICRRAHDHDVTFADANLAPSGPDTIRAAAPL